MQYYEIPLDSPLDADTVNTVDLADMNYLAWMIGIDTNRKKGLWLIESVRTGFDSPDVGINGSYDTGELTDDVTKYGYERTAFTDLNISQLLAKFTESINLTADAIANL